MRSEKQKNMQIVDYMIEEVERQKDMQVVKYIIKEVGGTSELLIL